jgi:hypothetical protein
MEADGVAPFLPDSVFIVLASYLDVRTLGRLACVASRFNVKTFIFDDNDDFAIIAQTSITGTAATDTIMAAGTLSIVEAAARRRWKRLPLGVRLCTPRQLTYFTDLTLEEAALVDSDDDYDYVYSSDSEDDTEVHCGAAENWPLPRLGEGPGLGAPPIELLKLGVDNWWAWGDGDWGSVEWHRDDADTLSRIGGCKAAALREMILAAAPDGAGIHRSVDPAKDFPHSSSLDCTTELVSWLRMLREAELLQAPRFTCLGDGLATDDPAMDHIVTIDPTVGVSIGTIDMVEFREPADHKGSSRTAVSLHDMRAGAHYIEFCLSESLEANMGVVNSQFGVSRSPIGSVHSWLLNSVTGKISLDDLDAREKDAWPGMPSSQLGCANDVIGMLLDMEARTLAIYKNGLRLGVMARELPCPLRWAIDVFSGSMQVRFKAPPHVSLSDLAAESTQWELSGWSWQSALPGLSRRWPEEWTEEERMKFDWVNPVGSWLDLS